MEALLGATRANNSCASVAEVQDQFRNIFGARVSDVAADHINESFKLQSNVVFRVPVTDSENEILESAASVDPQLGGAMSSVAPALGSNSHQTFRKINAMDALINQPRDDNALQQSVAKHLIASLSEIDRSTWIIRGVARTEQGWTFTYICKSSMQAWQRQTSKAPAKVPIGAYSNKDGLDPVNSSRPSFDCRGQLTIAFIKSSRTIEVKYEHTPLHKSVAELLELLAPEPPPLAPLPAATNKKAPKEPKAPKPPKEPRPPKTPRPPKKRQADGEGAGGEESQPKKRRKKNSLGTGQENTGFPPEMPGALPVGGPDRQYYSNQAPGDGAARGYPDGLVGSEENEASRSVSQDASVHGGMHNHSILNLPPGEASRRRDVAIQLLTQHGLDAETLSPEQFSIFANQSPELQKESLEMLVRYGAERLRIVHPNQKEGSAASQTPTPEQNAHAEIQTDAPQTPSGAKPTKSRRKKSDAATAQQQGEGGSVKKLKYTRGACELCRVSKDKCDKQKPMCSQCLAAGLQCEYALAKSRPSRGPKEARDDSEAAEQPHASPQVEPEQPEPMEAVQQHAGDVEVEQPEAEDEPDDLGSPGFPHHEPAHVPQSELIPPSMESSTYTQSTGIYQQHPSGLTFPAAPQTVVHEVSHQPSMASTALDYLSAGSTAETTTPNFTYPPPAPETQLTFPENPEPAAQHVTQHATTSHQRTGSRRALPMTQPTQRHVMNDSGTESHVDSWTAVSNSPVIAAATTNNPSPRLTKTQQPASHSASRACDDARQSSSWSTTAQPIGQTTAAPMYQSPRQAAAQTARAKSRQSTRPQTRTPVPAAPPAARPAQTQASQAAAKAPTYTSNTGASNSASVASYDYNQYSTSRAESSNTRVAYEPYSNHPAPTASNSYSGYDTYNPRQANSTASAGLANPASQTVASSYNATTATAPSSSQWGTTATNSQSRNAQPYTASQPASTGTAYGGQQQSQNLQGFSVRRQPPAQVRTSSSSYGQHGQQPQQQPSQRQQPPLQSHQQHQQSYSGYSNQQHTNNAPEQQQQQQSWYGFNTANNPNSAYNPTTPNGNSAYSGTASHTHGNTAGGATFSQQHHRSMNLSGHTYTSIDGEQALYDLLRNNPSG